MNIQVPILLANGWLLAGAAIFFSAFLIWTSIFCLRTDVLRSLRKRLNQAPIHMGPSTYVDLFRSKLCPGDAHFLSTLSYQVAKKSNLAEYATSIEDLQERLEELEHLVGDGEFSEKFQSILNRMPDSTVGVTCFGALGKFKPAAGLIENVIDKHWPRLASIEHLAALIIVFMLSLLLVGAFSWIWLNADAGKGSIGAQGQPNAAEQKFVDHFNATFGPSLMGARNGLSNSRMVDDLAADAEEAVRAAFKRKTNESLSRQLDAKAQSFGKKVAGVFFVLLSSGFWILGLLYRRVIVNKSIAAMDDILGELNYLVAYDLDGSILPENTKPAASAIAS